jgi:hypothetical protein
MTTVPGPRHPIYFAGTRVGGVLGWVPASGSIGMGVCIFSYDGNVTIGLQVDPRLVPDPQTIIEAIGEELTALEPLAGDQASAGASGSRASAASMSDSENSGSSRVPAR